MLRCQVKFGNVHRIEIQSNYKEFAVNDINYLNVVGYDGAGNIFSELDGFSLDWTVTEGKDIVKAVQTQDPRMRHQHQTDVFFVKGVKEGTAKVSAKLLEPGYESVQPVAIGLSVINPIVLVPPEPVYILPTSQFKFGLNHLLL